MSVPPSRWQEHRLGDIGQVFGGGTPSTNEPEYWGGGVPWVVPSEVSKCSSLYISATQRTITEKGLANSVANLLPPGAVMMTSRATIGEVIINRVPMATNQGFINVVCKPELVQGEFLAYWIQQNKQLFIARAHGVTFKEITKSTFRLIPILLPPLEERRAIAGVLETVQKAKEARQRELALERERKVTLMEYLFSRGILGKREAIQQTKHGDAPSDWQVTPLNHCAFIQTGVAKGRKLRGSDMVAVPYLRVANVQDGFLNLTEIKSLPIRQSELKRYQLQSDDVLLTEGGDFDKLGRGFIWHGEVNPCIHQNHIFAVRANREILIPEYLAYLVQSPYGKSYFLSVAHKTTNLASINKTKLSKFPALIPTLEEQTSIVQVLRACDDKVAALEREAQLIDELFRAMLEELMTGAISAASLIEEPQAQ